MRYRWLLAFLFCAPAMGPAHSVEIPPIAVVRTWDELRAQPAISVGDGTARLGLEAAGGPVNSGILLYCLTDGWQPSGETCGERLGPFSVEIRTGDTAVAPSIAEESSAEGAPLQRALFRKTIPLAELGKMKILLSRDDGTAVAEAEISATGESFHPWMLFAPASGEEEPSKQNGAFDAEAAVENRSRGIAVPSFDGTTPFPLPDGEAQLDGPLPRLFPEAAGDILRVTSRGTDLLVKSERNILLGRPDWHFLVRWWVNGKPFIPRQLEEFSDQDGKVITGRRLLLQLQFHPDRIGAKTGDTVELQLLYCRNEWVLVSEAIATLATSFEPEPGAPDLLLSNRVRLDWAPAAAPTAVTQSHTDPVP